MSKNPDEMNDDELEAAQREVDGEESDASDTTSETTQDEESTGTTEGAGATEQQEQTTTAETTEGADQAGEATTESTDTTAEAQTSAVATEPAKVSGVASKDGTRVLPYSALQAERRSHRHAAARADRAEKELQQAKQEIEDLRAGKSKDSGELTEAEVQRMEDEFPEAGAKMRAVFERNQELAKQVAATKPKETPVDADDPAQEAIDQVPLLVEWQHDPAHADKWQRSIELDNALINSPKWKGKDPVDRFAHVAKLVAEEFDIDVPAPKAPAKAQASSTTPAKPKPDPKKVIEQAETTPPNTLSDMKGGSVPDHGQVDFKNMTPQAMVSKFMGMTDDEIDRQLARLG